VRKQRRAKSKAQNKPSSVSGWLEKHQRGMMSVRWFVLEDNHLDYYATPEDKKPLGSIPFEGSHIEVAYLDDDSDQDDLSHEQTFRLLAKDPIIKSQPVDFVRRRAMTKIRADEKESYRFAIHTATKSYWFRAESRDAFEKWVGALMPHMPPLDMHLTVVEKAIVDLVQHILEDNDDCNLEKTESKAFLERALRAHSALQFQETPIRQPLTTLTSTRLKLEARQCFQGKKMFRC
jgi:hypothetical protein